MSGYGWGQLGAACLLFAGLLLGCASGSGSGAPPSSEPAAKPAAPAAPTQITSLELREAAPGMRLDLQATGPLVWTQYRDSEGRLVLELPNSAPTATVVDLADSGGLVQAVAVSKVDGGDRPLTRLVITTRAESEHELSAVGNGLQLTLVPAGMQAGAHEQMATASEPLPVPAAPVAAVPAGEPVRSAQATVAAAGTPDSPYVAPAPSGVAATRLEDVMVETVADGPVVRIAGDGDFAYSTFQLTDPPRFVIDLHGVVNNAAHTAVNGPGGVLQRVRVAQFKSQPEPVARVVLDLADDALPRLTSTGDGLVVSFGDAAVATQAWPSSAPAATETRVELAPEPAVEQTAPAPEAAAVEQAAATPAAEPAAVPAPAAAAVQVVESEPSDVASLEAVDVQDMTPPAPVAAPAAAPAPVAPTFGSREVGNAPKKYVGEPISFSLRDADIKEVLRTFAKISGLNLVVQPGVSAPVTVELEQVPWDQALEIILKTNNLGYELEGNIMRIAPLEKLAQEHKAEADRRKEQATAVPLKTVLKRVSYSSAGEIASLLKSGGGASILSGRGSVVVDARTNTLIIKELPEFMQTVLDVIDQIDVAEPQVSIESRILETTKQFSRTLGIQWGFDAIADAAHGNTTGVQFPNNGSAEGGVNLLTGGNNGVLSIALGNILDTFNLDATIQAAESEGLVNILSAPKVVTMNNIAAEIQSGLQIPVQTVANNTVTTQYVNATLRLKVVPLVTADGTILLAIEVQKREPQFAFQVQGATGPPIATKEAKTLVMVRDGGTAVIGGIYKVTNDNGEDRVPGLADIPILGHLFRNNRRNNQNEELMIFITAKVIKL